MTKTIFTVTLADLREEHFRGSGAGGQKRNKTSSGVRFTHEPSGAVAESEAQRSQLQNRQNALAKLAKSPKFLAWARVQAAAKLDGFASIDRKLDSLMTDDKVRVEVGVAAKPGDIQVTPDYAAKNG